MTAPMGKANAAVVQSPAKVVNTMKRVKEEIVRFDSPTGIIAAGAEQELQLFPGSGASDYTVRIGEGVELLSLGTKSIYDGVNLGYTENLTVKDRDGSEWNKFYITPETVTRIASNELPFNNRMNFERLMMSWGYKSFLSTNKDNAPTLKLPEGDRLRLFVNAHATAGSINVSATKRPWIPTVAITRRYLPGSDIDYKHFDQYDGGIKSTKRYYTDWQKLAATTVGAWTLGWELQIIRNEAYKFFQAGVQAAGPTNAANLVEAKIMIDDPLTEYNKYFVGPASNIMPFTETYATWHPAVPAADYTTLIEKTHRFAPTIDVIKNRNKDLRLYLMDNATAGAAPTDIITRFFGIRYLL